jgi:hypothetical protein
MCKRFDGCFRLVALCFFIGFGSPLAALPGFTNLSDAYTTIGFDPTASSNKVVVMASDVHMELYKSTHTTSLHAALIREVNAMVPRPAKLLFLGDAASTISDIPGMPVQMGWRLPYGTNEYLLFLAALNTLTNVPREDILWIAGNHDQMPFETDAELWQSFMKMPPYQTFDLCGTRFFLMNGGNYGRPSLPQQEWLKAQVASTSRTQEVAVMIHEPPFPGSIIFRGNALMLREAFQDWECRWWTFSGHVHCQDVGVWGIGRSNLCQITIATACTNVFNGFWHDTGFQVVCMSNGIVARISYHYDTQTYQVDPSPEWNHPKEYYSGFQTTEGALWRRFKSHSLLPELVWTNSYDSWDWLIYAKDVQIALPLSNHLNKATHFLLFGGPFGYQGKFFFSADRTNWAEASIPWPSNNVYRVPIPASLVQLPRAFFRLTNDGIADSPIAGWGLATTNEEPRVIYPQILPLAGVSVTAGKPVSLTAKAIDPYAPPDVPIFSIASGPDGAVMDSKTGTFSWRPPVGYAQNNISNVAVMLKVSDGILPELATTQTLWIAVHPPELPKISQLQRIHSGWEFQVSGEAGLGYRIEASTNLVNWETLSTTNPATLPFKIFDLGPRQGARYYRALAY